MSTITSTIYGLFTQYSTIIGICLLVGLLLYGSYYAYTTWYISAIDKQNITDVANLPPGNGQDVIIYFFFANWCTFCNAVKGDWQQFQDNYNGKMVNGYKIQCIPMDCSDKDSSTVATAKAKYGITEYPTVIMVKDGKIIDFDAKITQNSLSSYVSNMVG